VVEVITGSKRLTPTEDWLNYCNRSTARLLQNALATVSLRRAAEEGRQQLKEILSRKGLLSLEDVRALEPDHWDNLLERLACANLEDLYAAVGGNAIRLEELEEALEAIGITKEALGWTSIYLVGSNSAHRPGTLAHLAGIVSTQGGNILRSVNNSLPDGGFELRLVVRYIDHLKQDLLRKAFVESGIELRSLELV
jgi:GTP diphosphokinase / guanosine-3',5'-bis(diphosphate) 3'-diphosphatase